MHTMHTIASSIVNVVAGRQPLASILIRSTDTSHICSADNFVDPVAVRFAEDMPVARSPVLGQDEDHMMTIPKAGQAQTPIRRPTALRSPPPLRRVAEDDDDVTEEMKEEFGSARRRPPRSPEEKNKVRPGDGKRLVLASFLVLPLPRAPGLRSVWIDQKHVNRAPIEIERIVSVRTRFILLATLRIQVNKRLVSN
ncbi:hypothetical protein AX14_003425 [Amanita brunnescens Koide BX004]|nr:hypothetical protein AX14_003425 [Amanita brunnescens Koide BX004]